MLPSLQITVQGLDVSLGTASPSGRPALRGINWTLNDDEHWAVLGPNGAGKSTFLRLLRGDVRPAQTPQGGRIGTCTWTVGGEEDASPLVIKPLARMVSAEQQRIYTREGWRINGQELILSGFTDSLLPSFPDAWHLETAQATARELGAETLLDRGVTAMSQGQLRLVLLARAMVTKPRLLLLDESFDGLDKKNRDILHNAVNQAARTATIICTAHRKADLPACITHIMRLREGAMTSCGPVHSEAETPPHKTAPSLAHMASPAIAPPLASGPSPSQGTGQTDTPNLPQTLPPAIAAVRPTTGPNAPCALELQNVDVYVDREKVLHNLIWRVAAGENWRVSGSNGSGKSTLLRLIAGLEHVALGGSLRWFGLEHPPLETRRKETGYLSDLLHATYTYDLTGLELTTTGFEGSVGIWQPVTKKQLATAKEWIRFLGLTAMAHTPVSRLSSGTARRFFLARALVGSPRLLLLDEPCSGLDADARAQFLASLNAVLTAGVQCLYVSHHDSDVPAAITHELRLEAGRIVHAGRVGAAL